MLYIYMYILHIYINIYIIYKYIYIYTYIIYIYNNLMHLFLFKCQKNITQQRDIYDTVIIRFLQISYGLTIKGKV